MTDETAALHEINEGLADALAAKQSLLVAATSERDRLREINAELLAALLNTRQYVETAHRAMMATDKIMAKAVKYELDRIDAAITKAEAGK